MLTHYIKYIHTQQNKVTYTHIIRTYTTYTLTQHLNLQIYFKKHAHKHIKILSDICKHSQTYAYLKASTHTRILHTHTLHLHIIHGKN